MPRPKISDIVYAAAKAETHEEKIHILRQNDSMPLRIYLGMTLDQNVRWDLPPGAPPFKPNPSPDCEMALYQEATKMNRFHTTTNLTPRKRQELFVSMLEGLDPDDAKFLIEVVINKTLPEGLTKEEVLEALPMGIR